MKKDLTELVFVIDKSGSMGHLVDDTIGGFNSMIEKQKNESGSVNVTTVLFSSGCYVLHDCIDINEVEALTPKHYVPYGMTALFDAIGRTIDMVGERLSNTPEDERPEKVIFVITTDGKENASEHYTRSQVKEMIEHQQDKYSWTFMFLGANINAEEEAESLGIHKEFSKTYTASNIGVASTYQVVSDVVSCARSVDTNSYDSGDWISQAMCFMDDIV